MKSKIQIDIDHDNQPIIRIDYIQSEDVRDKMVKRFLETFGSEVCWAKFQYEGHGVDLIGVNSRAIVRPICAYDLPEESKTMVLAAKEHLKMRDIVAPTP
jgi:hypothetical protein